jgi:hypothetical protein
MSLLGSAVLVNWGGINPDKEEDYNQWHSKEHMPERISLPGFLRGYRALGIEGTNLNHKYFMMYEAKNKEVFVSKEYLERLNNPTKWTKEILSNYVSPSRTICSVISSKSIGSGNFILTVRFLDERFNKNHDLEQLKVFISKITEFQNITGMHFLVGDNSFGQMNTEEKKYRSSQGKQDQIISQAIILEGLNIDSLKTALDHLIQKFSIKENERTIFNFYTCQHILTKQDLSK